MKTLPEKYKKHFNDISYEKIYLNYRYKNRYVIHFLRFIDHYLRKLTFIFPKISYFLWLFKSEKVNNNLFIKKLNLKIYKKIIMMDKVIIFRVTHVFLQYYMLHEVINNELIKKFDEFKFLSNDEQFHIIFLIITKVYKKYEDYDVDYVKDILIHTRTQKNIIFILNFWGSAPIIPSFFSYVHTKKRRLLYQTTFLKFFNNKYNYDGYFFKKLILSERNVEEFIKFLSKYKVILLANKDFLQNSFPNKLIVKHFTFGYGADAIINRRYIFNSIHNYLKKIKHSDKYIILSQCSGELAFLINSKLHENNIYIKHIDIGQALNYWLVNKANHRTPFNKFINK